MSLSIVICQELALKIDSRALCAMVAKLHLIELYYKVTGIFAMIYYQGPEAAAILKRLITKEVKPYLFVVVNQHLTRLQKYYTLNLHIAL